jgi:hypothetical protein
MYSIRLRDDSGNMVAQCWYNLVQQCWTDAKLSSDQGLNVETILFYQLNKYNAKICEDNTKLMFDTNEDRMNFLLTWS